MLTYITRRLPKSAIMAIHIVTQKKINRWTSVSGSTSNSLSKIKFFSAAPSPSLKSVSRAFELFPVGILPENVSKWNMIFNNFSLTVDKCELYCERSVSMRVEIKTVNEHSSDIEVVTSYDSNLRGLESVDKSWMNWIMKYEWKSHPKLSLNADVDCIFNCWKCCANSNRTCNNYNENCNNF